MGGWCALDILHRIGYDILYRGLKIRAPIENLEFLKIFAKTFVSAMKSVFNT